MMTATGTLKTIIPFRFNPGEDVYRSMEALCREQGITAGVLLSGIGSLDGVRFCDIRPLEHEKCGCGYGDPITMEGLFELLSISGVIGRAEDGAPNLHLHFTFADGTGRVCGGHMGEGCTVKMTVEGVIGVLDGVAMERKYAPELDVKVLQPRSL